MMDQKTILIRTTKGEEEIRSGKYDIMPNQRIALNFIDGKSTVANLVKKAVPSLRISLPGLLESLSIEGFARDISKPKTSKSNLKIAIPLGKATSSKKSRNLNASDSISMNNLATGLSDPPSARARERGEDLGAWQDALAGVEANALAKTKAPVNVKVTEQTHVWEKSEAEEEARIWAKAAAKAEAEAKAKAKAKAKARAEAEAKARAEAEAKAKAEAKARAEAEAKAEAKARAENEAKDNLEVAVTTKQEVKTRHKRGKKARLCAEAHAKAKENDEKTHHEIGDEAKIIAASEAYAKAVAMAEEEAKTNTDEIDHKIREEATVETETPPILPTPDFSILQSPDSEETLADENRAKVIVDNKASAKVTSKAGEEGIRDEKETRNNAVTQEEAWQKEDLVVSEAQITMPSTRRRQKPINLFLIIPQLLVILVSGAFLLPYVLPTSQYISIIEKIAADSVGEPVKVGSLSVSFLPISNLDVSNITIGNSIKIESAILTFSLFSSFSSEDLRKIELIGVNVLPGAYDRITKWARLSNAQRLTNFKQIQLKKTKFEFKNFAIPLLNGNIELVNGSKFSRALFATSDDKIKINVTPKRDGFLLNISAKEWKPSHSSSMTFSSFDAKVIAGQNSFHIHEMDGRIHDGVLKGTVSAKWSDGWIIKGQLEIERINFEKATKSFNSNIPVGGKLTSNIEISSKAPIFEQLYDALHINGVFQLQNGFIKIDLGNSIRSISTGDITGGQTRFNDLSGVIEVTGKNYQLRQLKLSSGILSAEGNLDIDPNKKLSGQVISKLKGAHTRTSGPVSLEGTIKDPVLVRHYVR